MKTGYGFVSKALGTKAFSAEAACCARPFSLHASNGLMTRGKRRYA
ncbi:hypothetical protein ASD8599_01286 [Ascidiaceihabitans donghaensis]|uniref:Uncharacterized protein n=1 Tax=Ascidiaceihabitans donghaensis TaxID=1510460 RepID=A0A2R8BBV6_9RHOB|nr:hypothetical protein ASD8599_01286 [Ascidiaceihabitans donghaensis]